MNNALRKILRIAFVAPLLGALSLPCLAHGDEPHGDAPHPAATSSSPGALRFEAANGLFEVVGRIDNGGLTLFVSRFATNEPVLQAKVVVEVEGEGERATREAEAVFEPEQGRYVVQDGPLLTALRQPGRHDLALTVTAGDDADLLEAHLVAADAPQAVVPRSSVLVRPAVFGPAAVLVVAFAVALLRRRRMAKEGAVA